MSVLRGLDEGFEGGDEVGAEESGALFLLLLLFACERGLAFERVGTYCGGEGGRDVNRNRGLGNS